MIIGMGKKDFFGKLARTYVGQKKKNVKKNWRKYW